MATYPKHLRYTKDHEWLAVEDGRGRVGITDHAQKELGDVVFVELPAIGSRVEQGTSFGVVESVKAVSDLYAPVSGIIQEVNKALEATPELINQDPHGAGWIMVVAMERPAELEGLLDADAYAQLLEATE